MLILLVKVFEPLGTSCKKRCCRFFNWWVLDLRVTTVQLPSNSSTSPGSSNFAYRPNSITDTNTSTSCSNWCVIIVSVIAMLLSELWYILTFCCFHFNRHVMCVTLHKWHTTRNNTFSLTFSIFSNFSPITLKFTDFSTFSRWLWPPYDHYVHVYVMNL